MKSGARNPQEHSDHVITCKQYQWISHSRLCEGPCYLKMTELISRAEKWASSYLKPLDVHHKKKNIISHEKKPRDISSAYSLVDLNPTERPVSAVILRSDLEHVYNMKSFFKSFKTCDLANLSEEWTWKMSTGSLWHLWMFSRHDIHCVALGCSHLPITAKYEVEPRLMRENVKNLVSKWQIHLKNEWKQQERIRSSRK